jgi:hypothetical protein
LIKTSSNSWIIKFDFYKNILKQIIKRISVVLWLSVLLLQETGGSWENHWPVASHWQTLSNNIKIIIFLQFVLKFRRCLFLHAIGQSIDQSIIWIASLSNKFCCIVAVSFIVAGNRGVMRKPLTGRKSLTNFI